MWMNERVPAAKRQYDSPQGGQVEFYIEGSTRVYNINDRGPNRPRTWEAVIQRLRESDLADLEV